MATPRRIDSSIARAAHRQHGVVSARQVRALGVGRSSVWCRVASGELHPVLPRTYALGPAVADEPFERLCMSAILAPSAAGAIALETAAHRHGLWSRMDPHVHVVVAGGHRRSSHPRVTYHERPGLLTRDLHMVDGIATTSVTSTLADLGTCLGEYQLAHVMHEARYLRVLELDELRDELEQRGAIPGGAVVRRAIELHLAGSAGTRSRTEDRLVDALLEQPVPRPLVNMRSSTNVRGVEVDLAWPHRRYVVEVNGGGHDQPGAARHDAQRDEALRAAGWFVRRYPSGRVWNELDRVMAEIVRDLTT